MADTALVATKHRDLRNVELLLLWASTSRLPIANSMGSLTKNFQIGSLQLFFMTRLHIEGIKGSEFLIIFFNRKAMADT